MKQIIILFSTIILGIIIFNMIAGDGADSLKSAVSRFWIQEVQYQSTYP